MFTPQSINLLNFVVSIASAIDLIDPRIANHHKRVAYIANQIAREMGAPQKTQYDLVIAGLLHDIGALTSQERTQLLTFDDWDHGHHCEAGYLLLNKFRYFSSVSDIVRHHHRAYAEYHAEIPVQATLLHLADRIDALIDKEQPILEQVDRIVANVARSAGNRFAPDQVDAFSELAWKESFWLDVVSPTLEQTLLANCRHYTVELENDDLLDFAELLAHIIDFRCRFTATHSSGVAATASVLANLIGFSETECQKIKVAGYLHDIGKLAIPTEILEKNGALSSSEFRTIKSHAYYTYRILEPLQGMEEIRTWAALHHERLDGNGYPGRRDASTIPLGARIIAAADVFTALLEGRPYRKALDHQAARDLLEDFVQRKVLDRHVVATLLDNFGAIDACRGLAQDEAQREYLQFRTALERTPALATPGRLAGQLLPLAL